MHSSQQNDNRGGREKRCWDPAGIWRSGSSRKNSNHLKAKLQKEGVVKKRYWDPTGMRRPGSSRKNSNHLSLRLSHLPSEISLLTQRGFYDLAKFAQDLKA